MTILVALGSLLVGAAIGALALVGLVLFLAVQLAITVFTRADYLFMATAHTSGGDLPSDTASIAKALGGSYLIWGVVVGAISLVVLWGGVSLFLRMNGQAEEKAGG